MRTHDVFTTIRRALRRYRRGLAALLAGLAVLAALTVLAPPTTGTDVVVATRTVPAGRAFAAADLALRAVPASLVPDGAVVALDEAVGRTGLVTVGAGSMLTSHALLAPGGLVADGMLALPVSFDDDTPLDLIRVGDRIDLLGAGEDEQVSVIAADVRVVALPGGDDSGWIGASAAVVLVELSPAEAAAVTEAAAVSPLSFALR